MDVQKNLNTTIEEDDYIEEDFEEDNSDSPIEDNTDDREEQERLEREMLEQQRIANNRIQSTRPTNKLARPISATYDLSKNLNRPHHQSSQSNVTIAPSRQPAAKTKTLQ